jgi:hypothetical protein
MQISAPRAQQEKAAAATPHGAAKRERKDSSTFRTFMLFMHHRGFTIYNLDRVAWITFDIIVFDSGWA